jgi:hypothetical protein
MDSKITLSFNQEVIEKAKKFADAHNISLSRLTELIYQKITSGNYKNLEELPISDWVNEVSAGEAEYKIKPQKRKTTRQHTLSPGNENFSGCQHLNFRP